MTNNFGKIYYFTYRNGMDVTINDKKAFGMCSQAKQSNQLNQQRIDDASNKNVFYVTEHRRFIFFLAQ